MSRIDVSRVLRDPKFYTILTVRRESDSGAYVDGLYVRDGNPTEFTIKASVQKAVREQLHFLPENERSRETLRLLTAGELRTNVGDTPADYIVGYRNKDWKVVGIEQWVEYGIQHVFIQALQERVR